VLSQIFAPEIWAAKRSSEMWKEEREAQTCLGSAYAADNPIPIKHRMASERDYPVHWGACASEF
jgi:hypothetical protein